ncbi:MAG: hypothetical protein Cons2KO_32930 [Congregibacter sp.]
MTDSKNFDVDYIAEAGRKAKGKRPQFFELAETERVMSILMAVVEELAVTRERLDTVERLLEAGGTLDRSNIEDFHPTPEQARERGLMHQEYIARVMRILQQEREALEEAKQNGREKTLDEVSDYLGSI